jgi:hypothetical protein
MAAMATAVPCTSTEDNVTDSEITSKDTCCKKCSDLEMRLEEALKELSSAHLIIDLLRNEAVTGIESTGKQCDIDTVKEKNIHCDPTKKLHIKTKWSDIAAGRNTDRKKEEYKSKQFLETDITSPPTDDEWKTINRGHNKPSTVNYASYYQILVIINRYEQLRNNRKEVQVTHGPAKTHKMETRKEDREKIWKKEK